MPSVKIRIKAREPMVNVTYKVPPMIKTEVEKIAKHHGVAQGEVVRAFLEFSFDAYKKGKVAHVFASDSDAMKTLRSGLSIGDTVIASGNVGTVKSLDDFFVTMEICEGSDITTLREGVTDVLERWEMPARGPRYAKKKR